MWISQWFYNVFLQTCWFFNGFCKLFANMLIFHWFLHVFGIFLFMVSSLVCPFFERQRRTPRWDSLLTYKSLTTIRTLSCKTIVRENQGKHRFCAGSVQVLCCFAKMLIFHWFYNAFLQKCWFFIGFIMFFANMLIFHWFLSVFGTCRIFGGERRPPYGILF